MRNHTEFCLIATQGRPAADLLDVPNIIRERAREHSRKPEAFYRMVEERCPGSRLDWFARQSRDGWTTFGAEATLFDQREP